MFYDLGIHQWQSICWLWINVQCLTTLFLSLLSLYIKENFIQKENTQSIRVRDVLAQRRDYCAYKNTMRMRIYVDFFVLYHFSLKCNDWARIFLRIILAPLSKLEKMAIHVSGSQLLFHLTMWEKFCSHHESNSWQKRNGSRILGLICQPNNMSKTLFTFLKMQITAELLKECEQNFASLNILVHFD